MMNEKQARRLSQGAVLVMLGALVCTVIHGTSGVSMFARVEKGNSSTNTHSNDDIRKVMGMVRSRFRELNGCAMTNMRYDDAASLEEMKNRYTFGAESADDVIVIKTDFTTSKMFSEATFDGMTQQNYGWIFSHTPEGGWEFRGAGYC